MEDKIILIIIGSVLFICMLSIINQLRSEIARVNITLDKIAKQMGVLGIPTEDIDVELKDLISEGKKLRAIKRYRMLTGLGLKEAKEYVDLLSQQNLNG